MKRTATYSLIALRWGPGGASGVILCLVAHFFGSFQNGEGALAVVAFGSRDGDTGDAGQGLGKSFGGAGKSGERGDGAEFREESGGGAGPVGVGSQKSGEGMAGRVGADP